MEVLESRSSGRPSERMVNDMSTEILDAKLAELLKLDPDERIYIAEQLMASVPDESITDVDRAWLQVAAARARKLKEGSVKAMSVDEAFARAERALDAIRSNRSGSGR
jgi:putative addiction module component (TIGR02574 family)